MADAALGKLVVSLEAKIDGYMGDMLKAADFSKQSMSAIEHSADLAKETVKSFGTALLGLGVGFSAEAIAEKFHSVAESMGNLVHASEMTGASVEKLSAIQSVASVLGVSFDQVETGMTKFAKSLAAATTDATGTGRALAALGLDASKLRTLDAADAYTTLAKRLNEFEDDAGKAAIAQVLLGRAGAQQLPLLKELAEGGDQLVTTTTEQANQAHEYEKALNRLALQKDALIKKIVGEMLPAAVAMTNTLRLMGGEADSTQSKFKKFADDGSLKGWTLNIIGGFALVGDVFQGIGRAMETLGDAMGATFAKIRIFIDAFKGSGNLTFGELIDKAKTTFGQMDQIEKEYEDKRKARFAAPLFSETLADQMAQQTISQPVIKEKPKGSLAGFTTGDTTGADKSAELMERVLRAVDAAETKAADIIEKFERGNTAIVGGIQLETEMLGKNALERDKAVKVRAIDLKLTEDIAKVTEELGKIGDIDGIDRAVHRLNVLADTARGNVVSALDVLDAKRRSWDTGFNSAISNILDDVNNKAKAVENLVTSAFKGMEDALVNFVKTGKLDFKSLADSIITDLIRIQIQQSITGPLAAMMQGFSFSSLFGGGRASGGAVEAGTTYMVGESGPEMFVPSSSGTIVPNGAGAGGNYAVTINVSGGASKSTGDVSQLGQLAKQLEAAVKTVLVNERRNGGLLAA